MSTEILAYSDAICSDTSLAMSVLANTMPPKYDLVTTICYQLHFPIVPTILLSLYSADGSQVDVIKLMLDMKHSMDTQQKENLRLLDDVKSIVSETRRTSNNTMKEVRGIMGAFCAVHDLRCEVCRRSRRRLRCGWNLW